MEQGLLEAVATAGLIFLLIKEDQEFPLGAVVLGSGIATTVPLVPAVVQSLAQELPHAIGTAPHHHQKKKKKRKSQLCGEKVAKYTFHRERKCHPPHREYSGNL